MRKLLLCAGAAVAALPILTAGAALPANDAVVKGSAYIYSHLQADGSYGATSPGQNMDSILAVRAAGYDPAKDRLPGGLGPADYLNANAATITGAAGSAKAALAAKALGLDPLNVGGTDLIAAVTGALDEATGRYGDDDFSQSIAILGLACTGHSVDAKALTALQDAQLDDGGWGFGGFADPDTTAIALQALLAAGVSKTDPAILDALASITGTQADDGGWGFDGAANANSTAFVVQSLLALGLDPESAEFTKGGQTPIGYLLSQQLPDGSFEGFDPLFATNQVVPALAGRTFCNAADTSITRQREQQPTPTATATATSSPSPTATAPAPPATGSGQANNSLTRDRLAFIALGMALLASTGAFALRRR